MYLTGAGVGHLGIVDYDSVEVNNLHRQLLHTEQSVGQAKSESARNSLAKLNSAVKITVENVQLNSQNAREIIQNYDIVLDATDNVATRYLLNDACVLLGKPLVSGSALQFEGQLTVYNHLNGPCYRCIFPKPPPPETVTNCGDGGVLGAIPGVIGVLQALEAIKVILKVDGILTGRLLLFDGVKSTFRTVRLRGKRIDCDVCSDQPKITQLIDYEQFCGTRASDKEMSLKLLTAESRISVQDYSHLPSDSHLLIDVRSSNEFEICRLDHAINVPIKSFERTNDQSVAVLVDNIKKEQKPVFVLCRRGNDSQIAVQHLGKMLVNAQIPIRDIIGGLHAWSASVDPNFPVY